MIHAMGEPISPPSNAQVRLPYSFAKSQSIILGAREDGGFEAYVGENTPVLALAEVRRMLGTSFEVALLDATRFERMLADTYSRTDQTAAEVADDIGQDLDLSRLVQELPRSSTCSKAKTTRRSYA